MPPSPRPTLALTLATALAVAAIGCGDAASTTQPTTTPASSTTEPRQASVERIEVLGGPDWLAADDQWVYVKRDDGHVDRVDPVDGRVVASVDVGGDLCQGLGAGAGTVWTCRGTEVVGVDLDREEVVTTVPVTKAAAQGHLGVADGRVWVLLGDGSALVGVDVVTGEVGPEVVLDVRGTDLLAAPGSVWVVSSVDDAVVRVDTTTGVATWRADVGAAALALGPDGALWAGGRTTTRLDAGTGEVLGTIPDLGPGAHGSLAAADEGVWVRSQEAFLRRVGPDGDVLASHEADVTSGGDVLVAHGAVWTTAYDDAALFRITP